MEEDARRVAGMWHDIDELDFERIKAKMLHRKRGALTAEAIARTEQGYRQFLKLSAKFPAVPVVPNEAVDEFWHLHILDTQRYAADCERIFGHMLHHDPYVGIDGPEDETQLLKLAAATPPVAARRVGAKAEASASDFAK